MVQVQRIYRRLSAKLDKFKQSGKYVITVISIIPDTVVDSTSYCNVNTADVNVKINSNKIDLVFAWTASLNTRASSNMIMVLDNNSMSTACIP